MSDKKNINFGKQNNVSVTVFIDITDQEAIKVLDPLAESKLDKANLPENIVEIKSIWRKPNWTLSQLIEACSWSESSVNGRFQRYYDPNARISAEIKVLLKSWNLQELDANFYLQHEKTPENASIEVLTPDTMQRIGRLEPPEILSMMLNKVLVGDVEKNVVAPTKEPAKT